MKDFSHIKIVSDEMVEILRRKTPLERLVMGERMFWQARQLIVMSIRNDHPEWSDQEVKKDVVRRMHRMELPE